MGKIKRAQTMMEYAVGLAAVIAGLIGMQVYFSRGIQGNYKKQVDQMHSEAPLFSGRYSSYARVDETLPYNSTKDTKNSGEMMTEFSSNVVSRVVSADVNADITSGDSFFSPEYEFKDKFSSVSVREDYSLGGIGSVADTFSGKKLSQDKMLGE